MGIYRLRIEAVKIEIPAARGRRFIAPRVLSLRSLRSSVRGTMPLLFGGQRLAGPPRIGSSLGMAHIRGPVWRKRNLIEHRAINPRRSNRVPEHRMRNLLVVFPFPV